MGHEETFVDLLKSLPHWEFEIFLMVLVDGIILGLAVPLAKRWIRRHDQTHHGVQPKDTKGKRRCDERGHHDWYEVCIDCGIDSITFDPSSTPTTPPGDQ